MHARDCFVLRFGQEPFARSHVAYFSLRLLVITTAPRPSTAARCIWPPVYARFSVGEQGLYEPLVLGCIPKHETPDGREAFNKDVYWFSMSPRPGSDLADSYKVWTDK